MSIRPNVQLPCRIVLTRLAPRSLDSHDNLPSSCKYVVDALTERIRPGLAIGRADDSKEIQIEYLQEKQQQQQVRIQIYSNL